MPGARSGSRRRRATRRARRASCGRPARPPPASDSARNETIPPKSRIWRRATSWPGMGRQAGVEHALDGVVPVEEVGDLRARSRSAGACARASVLIPRSTSQASNGPGTAPSDFCRKQQPLAERVVVGRDEAADHVASGRRGTSSSSGRRRRRRARAAAGGTASRRCCRRRAARRPRAPRRRPRGCRRRSGAGSTASRPRPCARRRRGTPRGSRRTRSAGT